MQRKPALLDFLLVAEWILLGPVPQVSASLVHGFGSLPLEFGVGSVWLGCEIEYITVAPGYNFVGELAADCLVESLDDLEDSRTMASSQVPFPAESVLGVGSLLPLALKLGEGTKMARS